MSIQLAATKIRWAVIENYEIHRKAIYLSTKQTVPDVPKIGNTTTVSKWNYSIIVDAGQLFGARKSSLKYVIRSNVGVVIPHPTLVLTDHAQFWRGRFQESKPFNFHTLILSLDMITNNYTGSLKRQSAELYTRQQSSPSRGWQMVAVPTLH